MNRNQKTKEKVCAFYASDYHFEMISLPYIEKNIEEEKEIVVLTENNLEDTMNTLIEKVNLKEDKKKKILDINWKNDDLNKFKKIKQNLDDNKNMIVFIKGQKNYIKNVNENLEKWIEQKNIKIVDCYDIEEVSENMQNITSDYESILNTRGEKKIEKT